MAITIGGAYVSKLSMTYSWGCSPASAALTVPVLGDPVALLVDVGSSATITIGGLTFIGEVVQNPNSINQGAFAEIQIVDNRVKLMKDNVHLTLNNSEVREDDPATPGIDKQKRFWHILPEDWDGQVKTWTTVPYTAGECVAIVLGSTEVHDPWTVVPHASMDKPVYNIDANNGSKLGTVLQKISEDLMLVFTVVGAFELVFVLKGEGDVPDFPDDSTDRRLGNAASHNDTRVRIVGGRNRYQDAPIDLEPSWVTAYEEWWAEPAWIKKVRSVFFTGDDDEAVVAARARQLTVREFSASQGTEFEDHLLWGEVSRMEIPVWLYLNDIVYKAYQVPRDYTVNGIDLGSESIKLHPGLLQALEHDVDTGEMTLKDPPEYYPDGKAFVVAQGQGLDLIDHRNKEMLTPTQISDANTKWTAMNKFTLDQKNAVVIFEHAVFKSEDLFEFPNQSSITDDADPLKYLVVPNANATVAAAAVKAALVFDAEKYSKVFGSGARTGSRHWSALNYHAIMESGVFTSEVKYADDKGADEKATECAASITQQVAIYASGGFKRHGSAGTALSAVIDRVTVEVDFAGGLTETVDFTKERAQSYFEHERAMDRRVTGRDLFPHQKKNKEEIEDLQILGKLSKENRRRSPTSYNTLSDVPNKVVGNVHPGLTTLPVAGRNAGEVIWLSKSDGSPANSGVRFGGVVIASGYTSLTGDTLRGGCATHGVVPVRCRGPFKVNDYVGNEFGTNYCNTIGAAVRLVGRVQVDCSLSTVIVAPVRLCPELPLPPVPDPWTPSITTAEGGGFNYSIWPGTINNVIPDQSLTDPVGALGDAPKYVTLEVTTDGKQITAVVLGESDTKPEAPACVMGAPPTTFKVPLVYLGTTSAPISKQIWKTNLAAVRVLCHQSDRTSPVAGQSPWDNWFTWVVGPEVGPQHIAL